MHITGKSIAAKWLSVSLVLGGALLLAGCGETPGAVDAAVDEARPERVTDSVTLRRGEQLFQQNCAACHGEQAQGAEEWHRRNPDGTFPPPPLNGTAHAWHHPLWQLRDMIRYGGEPHGGTMPAFSALSDGEIDALIAWFQSLWSDEVYEGWLGYQARYPTVEAWEAAFDITWPVGEQARAGQ